MLKSLILLTMKTFVFATDFSQNACSALPYAIPIIQQLKGRLILFHAYDYVDPYVEVPAYVMEQMDEARAKEAMEELEIWKKFVHGLAPDLPCETIARKGTLMRTLLDLIEQEEVDAVFMGTKGASGIKRILIGSNTASVIGKTPCPVLAIPEGSNFEGIDKIVYATDFQSDDGFILQQLKGMANVFKAKVDILHVVKEGEEIDHDMYEWYKVAVKNILDEGVVSFRLVPHRNVQEGISHYVQEELPDIVVMAMHKKDWIDRLLKGSFTKRQAYHTQKPLLVFHVGVREKAIVNA